MDSYPKNHHPERLPADAEDDRVDAGADAGENEQRSHQRKAGAVAERTVQLVDLKRCCKDGEEKQDHQTDLGHFQRRLVNRGVLMHYLHLRIRLFKNIYTMNIIND